MRDVLENFLIAPITFKASVASPDVKMEFTIEEEWWIEINQVGFSWLSVQEHVKTVTMSETGGPAFSHNFEPLSYSSSKIHYWNDGLT